MVDDQRAEDVNADHFEKIRYHIVAVQSGAPVHGVKIRKHACVIAVVVFAFAPADAESCYFCPYGALRILFKRVSFHIVVYAFSAGGPVAFHSGKDVLVQRTEAMAHLDLEFGAFRFWRTIGAQRFLFGSPYSFAFFCTFAVPFEEERVFFLFAAIVFL